MCVFLLRRLQRFIIALTYLQMIIWGYAQNFTCEEKIERVFIFYLQYGWSMFPGEVTVSWYKN